jgi:hypothetical protein
MHPFHHSGSFWLIVALLGLGAPAGAGEVVELDDLSVHVEWNSTDTDYGIQFFWDSDGFTKMRVSNEAGNTVLDVKTKQNVRRQGLTEGFFESVEPPSSELNMEQFFERFPEGTYTFEGKGTEGEKLEGETEFTHTLPAPPANLSPGGGEIVSAAGFVAGFDPVTQDTEGNALEVELYVLVLEKLDDEPILQVLEVILPPSRTSVTIPGEFLEPDTEYKLEIIAQEESGNRTITETEAFSTDSSS